jgi:hypothetical protein
VVIDSRVAGLAVTEVTCGAELPKGKLANVEPPPASPTQADKMTTSAQTFSPE